MSDTLTDHDTVRRLRALLSYELPPNVSVQTGAGTNAPAAVFADSDFEVGDGVCGLHACGKQANEPCIPYVRADALMHVLAENKALREALKPFARIASEPAVKKASKSRKSYIHTVLPVADLHAARTTIQEKKNE